MKKQNIYSLQVVATITPSFIFGFFVLNGSNNDINHGFLIGEVHQIQIK